MTAPPVRPAEDPNRAALMSPSTGPAPNPGRCPDNPGPRTPRRADPVVDRGASTPSPATHPGTADLAEPAGTTTSGPAEPTHPGREASAGPVPATVVAGPSAPPNAPPTPPHTPTPPGGPGPADNQRTDTGSAGPTTTEPAAASDDDSDVVVAELVPAPELLTGGEPGGSAQVLWTAAQALRTAGKLDEAADCLREIVRIGQIDVDRHARTRLMLAQTLLDGGNPVQAMTEAKRVATGSTGGDTRAAACLLWAQSALAHGDRSQTAPILTELAALTSTEPDIDSAQRMAETMAVLARWWRLR